MKPEAAHDYVRREAERDPRQSRKPDFILSPIEADAFAQFRRRCCGPGHDCDECTFKRARALADEPVSILEGDPNCPVFMAALKRAAEIFDEQEAIERDRIVARIAIELWRR